MKCTKSDKRCLNFCGCALLNVLDSFSEIAGSRDILWILWTVIFAFKSHFLGPF